MTALTKKALAEALRERLKTSKLENIRIRDITDDVGLNRQTFYYHFQDIYELLEWMFEEEAKKILLEESDGDDFASITKRVVEQVRQEETILRNIYASINRQLLDKYLRNWVAPFVKARIDVLSEGINISEENRDFILKFFVMAILGLTFEWFESGMDYDILESLDKVSVIFDGDIREILRKFEE